MTREEAARMTYDELEAAGYCECGRTLARHKPLEPVGPIDRDRHCFKTADMRRYDMNGRPKGVGIRITRSTWR